MTGSWLKLGGVVFYAVIVGGAYFFAHRNSPPPPAPAPALTAAQVIERDQKIGRNDIALAGEDKIVDRYAVRRIEKGAPIAAADVTQVVPSPHRALAVLVAIKPSDKDGDVTLCLDGKVVAKARPLPGGKCDAQSCQVAVPLDEGNELSLAEMRKVSVMSGAQNCK